MPFNMFNLMSFLLDNSIFNWGLGVGIMYMMSAGKAEINKLNMAMDDTAKVIQELKAEISKRKSSRHLKFSSSWNELSTDSDKIRGKLIESVPEWSTEDRYHVQDSGFLMNEEGECASVLTEEPQQEVQQMDHLEAELESELQKLSWTSKEASGLEGNASDIFEVNFLFRMPDSSLLAFAFHQHIHFVISRGVAYPSQDLNFCVMLDRKLRP